MDIVTVCRGPRALFFWKGWLYVVPLPPHSVLSCEERWVLVLGVVKLYTVLPMANCTEEGPGSGDALNPGKGFTEPTRKPRPAFHILSLKFLSLAF